MARSQQCQLIQYRRRPMGTSDFAPSARWNPRKHFDRRPAEPMESIRVHGVEPTILSFWGYQQPTLQWKFTMWGGFPLIVKKNQRIEKPLITFWVFFLYLWACQPPFFSGQPGTHGGPIPRLKQLAPEHGHSHARALATRWVATWARWFFCADETCRKAMSPQEVGFSSGKKQKKQVWGRWRFFFCDGCMSTKYPKP